MPEMNGSRSFSRSGGASGLAGSSISALSFSARSSRYPPAMRSPMTTGKPAARRIHLRLIACTTTRSTRANGLPGGARATMPARDLTSGLERILRYRSLETQGVRIAVGEDANELVVEVVRVLAHVFANPLVVHLPAAVDVFFQTLVQIAVSPALLDLRFVVELDL